MTPDERAEAALPCTHKHLALESGQVGHWAVCPAFYRSAVAAQIRKAVEEERAKWSGYNPEQIKRLVDERLELGRRIMGLQVELTTARTEEREACATLAANIYPDMDWPLNANFAIRDRIARAIRARGEQETGEKAG